MRPGTAPEMYTKVNRNGPTLWLNSARPGTRGRATAERRAEGVPTYDFFCEDCGPFELRRPVTEAGEAAACPACGAEARRVYAMPNTKRMPTGLSGAMNRAEKSAHEPEVARRRVGDDGGKHRHSHGRPWQVGH